MKKFYTVSEALTLLENFCAYRERCHKEVEEKLRQMDLIPQAKEHIILSLMASDHLNEERYARAFARGKHRIKHWGKQRIVRELKWRDISPANIKIALSEIDAEDYLETLNRIAQKQWQSSSEPDLYKKRKKCFDFLLRKGYEADLIQEVLATCENA